MIDFRLEKTGQDPMLALSGELTVESCEALKKVLLDSLEEGGRLSLDLGGITAVDAAGYQLLCSALRTEGCSAQEDTLVESLPEGLRQAAIDAGYVQRNG
jgi:ABC-type transporter Mla MlaB component